MTLLKQFTDWVTLNPNPSQTFESLLAPAVVLFNRDGSYFGDLAQCMYFLPTVLIDS